VTLDATSLTEPLPESSSYTSSPLWRPALITFVSSACMMVLELVAGRIIAPYVGVSLYTWTSVIGIVLAGMSLGNYIGGRLADRRASLRLLGTIFTLAGILSLGVLAVDLVGGGLPDSWPIILQIVALTTMLFFLPSMVLGMVSPVVAKLAVQDLRNTGSTVGRIYAAGAAGSIVGTFATGFWLISEFGTHAIVAGVAALLVIIGLLFFLASHRFEGNRSRRAAALTVVALLGLTGVALALQQGWLGSPCSLETDYFCIKVTEEKRDGETLRVLILDRLVHSYNSLEDPTRLTYGYERVYAGVTALAAQRQSDGNPLRALFIGGGGYTFPRYMEAVYLESRLDVVEIDPDVTGVAHDLLGLSRNTGIATFNEDARIYLERKPDRQYDLVMGDAFNDYSVPYHLTTREFNERVRAWMADDGLYMVNMIDGLRRDFLRAYIHTLQQTFEYVYVIPANRSWRESPRMTYVLVASDSAVDVEELRKLDTDDDELDFAAQILSSEEVEDLLAEANLLTLTDRYAPVDQLLAPVARNEALD
jgi:spermidine synthase